MKRIALAIAAAAFAWLGTTTESSARPSHGSSTYVSGYTRCGCPIYVQRFIAYYDHCGRPVWKTRVVNVGHRCHRYSPPSCNTGGYHSGYRGGYQNGYHNRNQASYQRGGVRVEARW